jgi:hypothetical protein
MIWIADDDDAADDVESMEQTIEHNLDSLDLDDPDQLTLASMVVHLRLAVMSGLFESLSELMDPDTNDNITADDVRCLRQLIQAVDSGVEQIRTRWDL